MAFNRVCGNKVENQTVFGLAVTMDTSHPLLKPVRIPGNVVVKEDMAGLEIDTLACGFGCDQDLCCTILKLLLSIKAGAGFVPRPDVHSAMDHAHAEAPASEF